ncbi:MAG: peroxiredoxin-like family protein [Verrucomicrobiales bacterium]|nr:peroxiredoxin-like family protein [Verrucomicrobiales bacterium]
MKLTPLLLSACFLSILPSNAEEELLTATIEARKTEFRAKAAPEKLAAYAAGIEAVVKAQTVEKAVQQGAKAPDFTLPNAKGSEVTLSEKLAEGPVVLTWYRGGWCPYCNIQLAAYQKVLPQIEELGAQLIAISPEVPDKSLSTTEKNSLRFEVLSDVNSKVAKDYGLVFELTPEVEKLYADFFDIVEYNGEEAARNELPLAATYVIAEDGTVAWAFLDADYTKRAEPRDIIDALDRLE